MQIVLICSNSETQSLLVGAVGQLHCAPTSKPTDEQMAQANKKLQEIFEQLGFGFCDCEENEEPFSFPNYVETSH